MVFWIERQAGPRPVGKCSDCGKRFGPAPRLTLLAEAARHEAEVHPGVFTTRNTLSRWTRRHPAGS